MPKYKLKFKKTYQPLGIGVWTEVTDASLINVLKILQDKHQFEIISVKFKDCFSRSCIKIKCNKDDRYKIFNDFCALLGPNITEVTYF